MMKIFCLISLMLSVSHATTPNNIRQGFLDCHNYLRSQLAKGRVSGQPQAADMIAMVKNFI